MEISAVTTSCSVVTVQNIKDNTILAEKSLNELQKDLDLLSEKLEAKRKTFLQMNQQNEVYAQQELELKKKAHDLNENVVKEQKKADNLRLQVEAQVEDFVEKVNRVLAKNARLEKLKKVGAERKRKEKLLRDERRRKFHRLKGEMEALLVFKDYEEAVTDELKQWESTMVPNVLLEKLA